MMLGRFHGLYDTIKEPYRFLLVLIVLCPIYIIQFHHFFPRSVSLAATFLLYALIISRIAYLISRK